MIIDCHTHITAPAGGLAAADHLAVLDTVNICFVLATHGTPSKDVNRTVVDYIRSHKARMIGFAVINPLIDRTTPKALNFLRREFGLQGIVLYCPLINCHPAHSKAMHLYESAQELQMPVFFHNGMPLSRQAVMDYTQPYLLDEIARTFPKLRIIVGSMGTPFVEQTISLIAKHEHVYADLTMSPKRLWQVYTTLITAHEHEVMDKLLFGSGYPLGSPEAYIETLLTLHRHNTATSVVVPREIIRASIERDTLSLLGLTASAQ